MHKEREEILIDLLKVRREILLERFKGKIRSVKIVLKGIRKNFREN